VGLVFVIGKGFFVLAWRSRNVDRTAAKRQAAFRKRMQVKGYRLIQIWVDDEGFPRCGSQGADVKKRKLTLSRLLEELARLTVGTDADFTARLYGELASYAGNVRELWGLTKMSPELFNIESESEDNTEKESDRP
jgi:hypothetical protein